MRKIITLLLSLVVAFTAAGCSNSSDSTKSESKSETKTESKSEAESESKDIVLNEPYSVSTKDGDYNFTITGAEKTDWWKRANNNEDKVVIILKYNCENISFSNSAYNGVFLDQQAFKIIDQDNNQLHSFSSSYDDSFPEVLAKGAKGSYDIPYEADKNVKEITVKFARGGEVTLPVK